MGGQQDLLVHPGGAHPVAGLDLVGVADLVAGQLSAGGQQPHHLGPQPVASTGGGTVLTRPGRGGIEGGAGVDGGQQRPGVGGQPVG